VPMLSTKKGEPSTPYQGVNLADMSGFLLLGVKALDHKQIEMEKTIKAQQELINQLAAKIEALEKK
ncbi:MAG: hypothetical protein ACK46R_12010, partial [Bacteroidota bacterium]